MSRRATDGDGHISGGPGHYRGHIQVNGRRIDRRGKTKAIVRAKLRAAAEAALAGPTEAHAAVPQKPTATITVEEFLDLWLTDLTQRLVDGSLVPRTFEVYERDIRLHLRPALTGILLSDLDRARVRDLQSELFKKPLMNRKQGTLGRASVSQCMRVLHAALQRAADDGLLAENPCDRIRKPRTDNVEPPPALTTEQGSTLLRKVSPKSLPGWLLAATSAFARVRSSVCTRLTSLTTAPSFGSRGNWQGPRGDTVPAVAAIRTQLREGS